MQTVLNADKTGQSSQDYKSPWKWKFLDRKNGDLQVRNNPENSKISDFSNHNLRKKSCTSVTSRSVCQSGQCNETTAKYFRSGHKHCIPKEFQEFWKFPLRKQNDQIIVTDPVTEYWRILTLCRIEQPEIWPRRTAILTMSQRIILRIRGCCFWPPCRSGRKQGDQKNIRPKTYKKKRLLRESRVKSNDFPWCFCWPWVFRRRGREGNSERSAERTPKKRPRSTEAASSKENSDVVKRPAINRILYSHNEKFLFCSKVAAQ